MSLDKINYENRIAVLETKNSTLNSLLKEANDNIETLKNMLLHHRDALKHATTWEEKHSVAVWRGSTGQISSDGLTNQMTPDKTSTTSDKTFSHVSLKYQSCKRNNLRRASISE
jgi:hypothetical protein